MKSRQTLRLHKPPEDAHQRFVSWVDATQTELEELIQAVTDDTVAPEEGVHPDMTLLDKYALVQNHLRDLRAAVLDHAWVADKLDWTKP